MSTTPPPSGFARPAAVVNEEIRTLMLRAGGRLRPEDRSTYHRLVEEWHAATARERSLEDVVAAA